jgi:hypothetical protein
VYLIIATTEKGEVVGEGRGRDFKASVKRLYRKWYRQKHGKGDRRRVVATCHRITRNADYSVYHIRMGYRPDPYFSTYALDPEISVYVNYRNVIDPR